MVRPSLGWVVALATLAGCFERAETLDSAESGGDDAAADDDMSAGDSDPDAGEGEGQDDEEDGSDDGSDGVGDPTSNGDGSTEDCGGVECHPSASCVWQSQSSQCVCDDGWYGDGSDCSPEVPFGAPCADARECTDGLCQAFPWQTDLVCSIECEPRIASPCKNLGVEGMCVQLLDTDLKGACYPLDLGPLGGFETVVEQHQQLLLTHAVEGTKDVVNVRVAPQDATLTIEQFGGNGFADFIAEVYDPRTSTTTVVDEGSTGQVELVTIPGSEQDLVVTVVITQASLSFEATSYTATFE